MAEINTAYIRTSLDEDENGLITTHYINEVLPQTKQFKEFHCRRLTAWVEGDGRKPLKDVFAESKELNERQTEDALIRPILESLDNQLIAQIPLGGDVMDFCIFEGESFADDYTNTSAVIESKRYGRIESKYYIRKKDNSDEVYQTLNYLRTINLSLNNHGSGNDVPFIVLTDGYLWRIYSKQYTHSEREYERRFVEFNLEAIANCPDKAERDKYLKLFGIFFCKASLAGALLKHQKDSDELEVAVTKELREQTFTALEYIATGIWRKIYVDDNPIYSAVLENSYGIDVESAHTDENERAKLLKTVYDESLVFLLRLLFVLYAEDRNLFDQTEIPKVVKGQGNLLDLIVENGKGIGMMDNKVKFGRNDDIKLGTTFDLIDRKYNGGLFSKKKHPLLYGLDIDDILFARAIDNLCRVQVKKRVYTVDFSTISERELGSIYESLLEYKLAIVDEDMAEMPSIVNKKRIRMDVKKGDLYLINHKGERKATGSYYTPDLIVDHLVAKGLDPMLEKAKSNYPDDWDELFRAVLDLKICDPAMGSGHMILACYARVVDFLRQSLEEYHADGKTARDWTKETAYTIRTQVARKCIYGVDLNPTAVELAKLVMWMKVFRPDKPFEFFDYNLACGNSLIGVYDETEAADDEMQMALFRSQEQVESDILAGLLHNVSHMMEMPRDNVEQVHEVDRYWKEEVRPLQRQVSFFYNVKLAKWLLPDMAEIAEQGYSDLVRGIDGDKGYVAKILAGDPSIPANVAVLAKVDRRIRDEFKPLHWRIAFPHVAVAGGFDMVISNPPWDKVIAYRETYFSDYIEGFGSLSKKDADAKVFDLTMRRHDIASGWTDFEKNVALQNAFYSDYYRHQKYQDSSGKILKGHNDLFKLFIEKNYSILRDGGICGLVVPDNLNIDNGCAGLRHLLLEDATIRELIMFENRKKLFDIHGQYKFDVLTFEKRKPRANAAFDAGFYWYDPIWLDGEPDADYISANPHNRKKYHRVFRYPVRFIKENYPDSLTILELKSKSLIDVMEKTKNFSSFGLWASTHSYRTRNEFNTTTDSDLFTSDGKGWPVYQGKMIRHYNAHASKADKHIVSKMGEERLSRKQGIDLKSLPDRKYRIAWRKIAQPTDTRSLICTVIPRGCFAIDSLYLIENVPSEDPQDFKLISGINVVLSSFVCDMFVRNRIAKNVNAFILESIPFPSTDDVIRQLGEMAMPLYQGDDFDAFRDGIAAIDDEDARNKLIARLDARVAHLYELTYEEYQSVLETFPLVEEGQKKRCLNAYNDWTFEL